MEGSVTRFCREFAAGVCVLAVGTAALSATRSDACGGPTVDGPGQGVVVSDVVVSARVVGEVRVLGREFLILDVVDVFKGDVFSVALLAMNRNNCDPLLWVGGEYVVFGAGRWFELSSTIGLPNLPLSSMDSSFRAALGVPHPPRRVGWLGGLLLLVVAGPGVLMLYRARRGRVAPWA